RYHTRSSLLHPAAPPLGSVTPAEPPLIDAEKLFRQPGPLQYLLATSMVSCCGWRRVTPVITPCVLSTPKISSPGQRRSGLRILVEPSASRPRAKAARPVTMSVFIRLRGMRPAETLRVFSAPKI